MSVAIPSGNDPFGGGSKTNNSPPTAVAGSIAPAQTGVANPIAGVNAGNPFFARNNRGSNIGIPYARCAARARYALARHAPRITASVARAGSAPSAASAR